MLLTPFEYICMIIIKYMPNKNTSECVPTDRIMILQIVLFDLNLDKRLRKQSSRRWFETT